MTRKERIARHNKNVKDAFKAAKDGEVINLSALFGGAETLAFEDKDSTTDEVYSDNWKIKAGE